uniref:Uncharacterized protein n=1 Tax=Candidatus Kentrum sp. LFY TaxID=2126342 RepID=A0A450WSP4_9GAMM|nr:MAG: hypothetical protein BECKLFY1418C_GA0070996_10673 [Candidatus Kentron sp. LFY]
MNPVDLLIRGGLLLFLVCAGFTAQADTPLLGRLFFSNEERQELDRFRDEAKEHKDSVAGEKQAISAKSFTMDGVVMRSNGKSTFWINGVPIPENSVSQTGIHIIEQPDNTIEIGFSCGSDDVRLKPGQKVICQGNEDPNIH